MIAVITQAHQSPRFPQISNIQKLRNCHCGAKSTAQLYTLHSTHKLCLVLLYMCGLQMWLARLCLDARKHKSCLVTVPSSVQGNISFWGLTNISCWGTAGTGDIICDGAHQCVTVGMGGEPAWEEW